MERKRKTTKSSKIKPKYKVIVYSMGKEFTCDTDDVKQAILDLKPTKITNKIRIIVKQGNKQAEKILFVYPARRLFSIPLAAEFFAKNIVLALK
jgi:hypothetical protein